MRESTPETNLKAAVQWKDGRWEEIVVVVVVWLLFFVVVDDGDDVFGGGGFCCTYTQAHTHTHT